jgi:hypothetical protein
MFPISMLSSLGALLMPASPIAVVHRRRRVSRYRCKRGDYPRAGVGRWGKRYLLKGVRP